MRARRAAVLAVTGVVAVGGAGVAIGATAADKGREAEQGVLDDAATRLGTSADELRDALAAAEDAQLDRAVKDGDLTQAQADRLKEARRQSGRVLGGPGAPHGFERFGGPRFGGPGFGRGLGDGILGDVAKALGTTPDALVDQLRDGKGIEAIAKANGKTLADVKAAARAAAKARLDDAVKDGDLTRAQADDLLAHLQGHIDHLGEALALGRPGRAFGPGPGFRLGPRGFGFGVRLEDVAGAVGITPEALVRQLRAGKSLAAIAKAEGKTLAGVKAATTAAVEARLDAAVKDGDLTRAQADDLLDELQEHIDRLGDATSAGPRGFGPGGHGWGHGRGFPG